MSGNTPTTVPDPTERRPPVPGTDDGSRTWWIHAVILLAVTVVLLLAFSMTIHGEHLVTFPGTDRPLPGICMFRNVTGLRCPGCGLTRSFISIADGRLDRAWHYNPAGILVFALFVSQVPFRLYQLARIRRGKGELRCFRTAQWILIMLAVLLLAQWTVRLVVDYTG